MDALAPYHFGHLPVWVDGNAYFNGATVSKHEKNGFIGGAGEVSVELVQTDGKYILKTGIYDFLKEYRTRILTTESLGEAFEPEERFENPDGSAIIFDRDYHGGHRGLDTLPGPFAEGKAEIEVL